MNKIEEIEKLLKTWKTRAEQIPACEQADLMEARDTANGISLALEIFKKPTNNTVATGACTCEPVTYYKPSDDCPKHGKDSGF